MRHRVNKKTLNRTKDQRKALITGMASDLIQNGNINTTLAKAKVLRPYVEKLVTKAIKANKSKDKISKFNTVKMLRKKLRSELAISILLEKVAPNFEQRPGGYTRIVKTGNREGDNAKTARIEFIENAERKTKVKEKNSTKPKKDLDTKKVLEKEKKKDENTK